MPTSPRHLRTRPVRRTPAALVLSALLITAVAGYTVQPGDNLSAIARAHGTSVQALVEANGLADPNRIIAGQRLALPGSASGQGSAASAGPDGSVHTVATGETLSSIANRYGVSATRIAEANGLADPNLIRAGARLTIPGVQAAAPAATTRDEVGALIERTARAHGWNPAIVKAVAWQESGWNNSVVSSAGAIGIMQVMPATGDWVSRYLAKRPLDLRDPADNVLAGVLFLDYLYGIVHGDVPMMLAGYYQGLRNVADNGMYASTERYIANVLALRERYR